MFDFTLEGEALGYFSLDQARVLAMRTARETPGDYGRRFRTANMAFEVVEDTETEDHYVVTLSFRPGGEFTGTLGASSSSSPKRGRYLSAKSSTPLVFPGEDIGHSSWQEWSSLAARRQSSSG